MALLRRLKDAGIARLQQFVTDLQSNSKAVPPTDALTSDADSEPLEAEIEVEQRMFASRLDWASYIDALLDGSGLRDIERDVGLWAWLSLFRVEELLPTKANGRKSMLTSIRTIDGMLDLARAGRSPVQESRQPGGFLVAETGPSIYD